MIYCHLLVRKYGFFQTKKLKKIFDLFFKKKYKKEKNSSKILFKKIKIL